MDIILILHFTDHELVINKYTTIDISRAPRTLNINISNTEKELSLSETFDLILKYLGKDETFSVTIQTEKSKLTFHNMDVDYHLNADAEVLHLFPFVKPTEQ